MSYFDPIGRLVLIRGLPGSGKSTIARMLAENFGYWHVEADDYFDGADGYQFDPAKLPDAHAFCQRECLRFLRQGYGVVVANTFTRRWEMKPYLDMAATYDATVSIITAKGNWPNVHGVPDEAIARMRERWEAA